jgi:hypothetical protein
MLWASGSPLEWPLASKAPSAISFLDYSRIADFHQCAIDSRSVENRTLIDFIDFDDLS